MSHVNTCRVEKSLQDEVIFETMNLKLSDWLMPLLCMVGSCAVSDVFL
jgi:hypothetical protein